MYMLGNPDPVVSLGAVQGQERKLRVLHVSVNSWIIQDGNYGNFRVGDSAKFALEICPHTPEVARFSDASFECNQASQYRIRGQMVAGPKAGIGDGAVSLRKGVE